MRPGVCAFGVSRCEQLRAQAVNRRTVQHMNRTIAFSAAFTLAASLLAADAKEEVKAAAKKLADASGYSWKATTEMGGGGGGGGGGRFGGPTEGKTLKDGTICLVMTRGENTFEAFKKGEKGAFKTQDGWQSLADATAGGGGGGGGQGNPGRFMGRTIQNYKAPAEEAADMAAKVKALKKEGDAWVGELTEEGAKSFMTFGRGGGGGNAPEISGAAGTVKFWTKDGVLSKYEYNLKGSMNFNGNERALDRTTTVEIKDVGATKLEIPAEAKAKMS